MERRDANLLSSVQNGLILLAIGLAILQFGDRIARIGLVILVLVILIIGVGLYNYRSQREQVSDLGWGPYLVLVLLLICIWFFYEALLRVSKIES